MITLFQGPVTNVYQPSQPTEVVGGKLVLDFTLVIANIAVPGTRGTVAWYLEYTDGDPHAAATAWYRETSEELMGEGDVKHPAVVRRFTDTGADQGLAEGTHRRDIQLRREHAFYRIQICVLAGGADNCNATVLAPFTNAVRSA